MKDFLSLLVLATLIAALAACGSSDKSATDPNVLLTKVQGSQLGAAYKAYNFFADSKWTPLSDPQQGALVKFDGLYDMNKVVKESCAKQVEANGPDSIKDLEKITQMTHSALFGMKDGAIDIRFSGWTLLCVENVQKNFPDPEMNTQQEIMSNAWRTDCPTMLEIARKGCAK